MSDTREPHELDFTKVFAAMEVSRRLLRRAEGAVLYDDGTRNPDAANITRDLMRAADCLNLAGSLVKDQLHAARGYELLT